MSVKEAHTATDGIGGSSRKELKMWIFQNIRVQKERLLEAEESMHAIKRRIMMEKCIKTDTTSSKLDLKHFKYLKTIRGFESKREKAVTTLADLLDLLNDIEATPGNTEYQIERLDAILNSPAGVAA
jgi:hypothetical protein